MTTQTAALIFGNMRGYPKINGKIPTIEFLDVSMEIVSIIDNFGKIFHPVVIDMNGNIEKIRKTYQKNPQFNQYLDDLIVLDLKTENCASEPLLWLKRALELIFYFFTNILNDLSGQEEIHHHLKDAYNRTLKPYHGWLIQHAFGFIYRWIPYRSQLVGKGDDYDVNMKHLAMYLESMKIVLDQINLVYSENNLNNTNKV